MRKEGEVKPPRSAYRAESDSLHALDSWPAHQTFAYGSKINALLLELLCGVGLPNKVAPARRRLSTVTAQPAGYGQQSCESLLVPSRASLPREPLQPY